MHKVGSVFEELELQRGFFRQGKYDEKFQKRINFIQQHTERFLKSFRIEETAYRVIPYMVTNKLFCSRYKDVNFSIVAFSEFKDILLNLGVETSEPGGSANE